MAEVRDIMRCGQCGETNHRIINVRDDDTGRDVIVQLLAECVKCHSTSEIAMESRIRIRNNSGDGTLCGGW